LVCCCCLEAQMMNDLAKGQKMMMDLLGQLALNTIEGQPKTNQNGERGSNNGEGTHSRTTMQSHPHLYTKTPRPTMPQFLSGEVAPEGPTEQDDSYLTYLEEYRRLGNDFQAAMSFTDFFHLKQKNRPRGAKRTPNHELQKTLGKVTIPNFDGSSKCSARTWVQKLDTYFQLQQMTEMEAIKLATLHLDGEAHEWWYHGLVTLGHAGITSYLDFTQRIIERFDRKDPEIHFRELAQLKQTGSPEAFISEFQRLAVMVTDISEARLVMLFVEGLSEPLRGWVKAYKPATLQDAVSRARDMQDVVPKSRFPLKPTFPQKNKEVKPFQKDWAGKPRLDEETRRELRKKKLCFNCQDPWVPGHRCAGKDTVGKAHYIEVYSDSDSDTEDEGRNRNRDTRHQVRRHHRLGLKALLWHPCQDFLGTTHSESEESCRGTRLQC
jgi:hypothetical protein